MATEQELAPIRSRLFGLIAEERITAVHIRRPAQDALEAFLGLTDLSPSVSDALDELGVGGGVPASTLCPLRDGQRAVGPAITIRYLPQGGSPGALSERGEPARLADRDLYGVGQAGDIAVFDCGGQDEASVMGGLSAAWARRLQIGACIIDGAVRDVEAIRAEGPSVWSRGRTPVSGKHRLEAIEINGTVSLAGVMVHPGDLVVADDSGVCVVPQAHIEAVRAIAVAAERAEREVTDAILNGASPVDVASIRAPERW
jgi:regulator of RNase E activity RraA